MHLRPPTCHASSVCNFQEDVSKNFTVSSRLAVARNRPSRVKARPRKCLPAWLRCCTVFPLVASSTCSSEPEATAMYFPLGEQVNFPLFSTVGMEADHDCSPVLESCNDTGP